MQRRWLEMQDFLTLETKSVDENKKHLFECKDNKSSTGHSLLVKLMATHSANPNKNKRFYRSDKMQQAIPTWTNKSVAVPVLHEHNTKGSVFGRVREARYIDETHLYEADFPILRDTAFYSTDSARIPLFDSVDWIVDNLVPQDNYTGLGHIELGIQLTDPEAIRKVFADEFLSVSVGFKTDAAYCSICHTDWAAEEKCSHKLGLKVQGKDTFLITGNLDYSEVSFVNFPADPFAKVISINQFTDSLNKRFYLGLTTTQQEALVKNSGFTMSDSLISLDDDISVFYEDSMDPKNLTLEALDSFVPEIKSKELTEIKAFEYKAAVDALTPETEEDKAKVRSIKSNLNSRIKKEKWTNTQSASIEEEMNKALADSKESEEVKTVTEKALWDGFVYASDDEKAFFEDSEGILAEINLVEPTYTDAIKTAVETAPPDMYCGPNKSFLVTDTVTANACKAVVESAPISAETKEKISKCIDAKEIELGIKVIEAVDALDTSKDFTDAKTGVPEKIVSSYNDLHGHYTAADTDLRNKMRNLHYTVGEHWGTTSSKERAEKALITSGHNVNAYGDSVQKISDTFTDAETKPSEILKVLDSLDKMYDACDDGLKPRVQDAAQSIIADWSTDGYVAWTKKRLAEYSDSYSVLPTSELTDKEDAINELTAELTAEKAKSATFFKESKKALATQIIMSKVFQGVDGFVGLTVDKLNDKINELSSRNIISLKDSVKDILLEQKFVKLSGTDSQEITSRVDEKTQVSEADVTTTLTDSANAEDLPGEDLIPSGVFKYLSPAEQARYLAEKRFAK